MKSRNIDIFISGAGPAGLLASISFASLGYSVICVAPHKPVTHANDAGADLRTTAFLQPAQNFIHSLDLWEKLKSYAVPMEIMRIIDAAGENWPPKLTDLGGVPVAPRMCVTRIPINKADEVIIH